MRPVIAIRPIGGAAATLAAGEVVGLPIVSHPLWDIQPKRWSAPDPAEIDGLLIGSANALRFAGAELEEFSLKPVYAVGHSTAALAESMGHKVASVGEGGLQEVIDALPRAPIHLLRLAGAERVPLELPPHVTIETRVLYETVPLPVTAALAALLRGGALVLLHSAAAARHFASECDQLDLPRAQIALAALGPRIAAAAGMGWADCRAAAKPNDAALLALAKEMCH